MAAIPRLFNNNAILSVGAKMKNILYDTDNYLIFSFNDVDTDVSATSFDGIFFLLALLSQIHLNDLIEINVQAKWFIVYSNTCHS